MASLSAGSIAWTRGPTLFGGGTQHRSTQARNAAPKAGILLCWCHVDWREASTPLVQWLHYRGGVAPAALIPREREMIPTANNPRCHAGVSFERPRKSCWHLF